MKLPTLRLLATPATSNEGEIGHARKQVKRSMGLKRMRTAFDRLQPGVTKYTHDIAVLRMIQAGAVPNSTPGLIADWFRDWAKPLAQAAGEIVVPFIKETAMVQDIYSRLEIAQAADAQAVEARAAEQTLAGTTRSTSSNRFRIAAFHRARNRKP